jgi:hypothetical protein
MVAKSLFDCSANPNRIIFPCKKWTGPLFVVGERRLKLRTGLRRPATADRQGCYRDHNYPANAKSSHHQL